MAPFIAVLIRERRLIHTAITVIALVQVELTARPA
jgi:hypothetical protein